MLEKDSGTEAIVAVLNGVREDIQEMSHKFEMARQDSVERRMAVEGRMSTLESGHSGLKKIVWTAIGAGITIQIALAAGAIQFVFSRSVGG